MVRMPSAVRIGASAFIAGWKYGANRKVKPVATKHSAARFSLSGNVNPMASIKSALPLRLEIDRLPCFTTGRPQAAASNAAPVDKFKLPEPSPPVPTISMASRPSGSAGFNASARIAPAKPRTSSAVTPLARSAESSAPAMAGARSGAVSCRKSVPACASLKSRRSSSRSKISRGLFTLALQEIAHELRAIRRKHTFRMKLHAFDR